MRIALHTHVRTDRIDESLDIHDYSADGAAAALPVVWAL
jgi:hypothetical protein